MSAAQTLRAAAVVGDLQGGVPVASSSARGDDGSPQSGVHVEVLGHLKSGRAETVLSARLGRGQGQTSGGSVATAKVWCEELGVVLDASAASLASEFDAAALVAVRNGVAT